MPHLLFEAALPLSQIVILYFCILITVIFHSFIVIKAVFYLWNIKPNKLSVPLMKGSAIVLASLLYILLQIFWADSWVRTSNNFWCILLQTAVEFCWGWVAYQALFGSNCRKCTLLMVALKGRKKWLK